MKILVIGGTRYFGKRLIFNLSRKGHEVTVLSRGNTQDEFAPSVKKLIADRTDKAALEKAVAGQKFDVVIDQVCMTAHDAEDAVTIFKGKTPYYLMTSTMSVYGAGESQKESDFDPLTYTPKEPTNPAESYAEGKRAAEKVFAIKSPFKYAFARFPVVVGEDDYTQRLLGQIQKIENNQPIYYPNLDAAFCFINSEDAAQALEWLAENKKEGPYNFASETFKLKNLIALIEKITLKKANLLTSASKTAWSPFGVMHDWSISSEKAESEGFACKPNEEWLPQLITTLSQRS